MPKVNWKKKITGVLGRIPHPYHRRWKFTYTSDINSGTQAVLDNYDLEECPYRNQIKIVRGSVLLYIEETDTSVHADLHLPVQVKTVIIHKYGKEGAFCLATVDGGENFSVYPGHELKRNPHKKR